MEGEAALPFVLHAILIVDSIMYRGSENVIAEFKFADEGGWSKLRDLCGVLWMQLGCKQCNKRLTYRDGSTRRLYLFGTGRTGAAAGVHRFLNVSGLWCAVWLLCAA